MLKLLSQSAPAKLNLFLRVTGRRFDGYHELDSIFIPIPLCDQVGIGLRSSENRAVHLRCDHPGLGPDSANLAVRAAQAFMTEFGIAAEVMIDLKKRIPVGAGLGGGSSDAAAVLRLMAYLSGVVDKVRLARVALTLGADVPYFLDPMPARVSGIGEVIRPLNHPAPAHLVLAVPPLNVSTAAVYQGLTPAGWSGPAPDSAIIDLLAGRITPALLVIDLAPIAIALHPDIRMLQAALAQNGAIAVNMTGSGGAVFGVFSLADDVAIVARRIKDQFPHAGVFALTNDSASEMD